MDIVFRYSFSQNYGHNEAPVMIGLVYWSLWLKPRLFGEPC